MLRIVVGRAPKEKGLIAALRLVRQGTARHEITLYAVDKGLRKVLRNMHFM
jgi:hypothetical protein